MGHTLGKTELNYQRALKKTIEKPTSVAEKLHVFYIAAYQLLVLIDSIKVTCPKQH